MIILIHLIIIGIFAFAGFVLGLSVLSTAAGVAVGLFWAGLLFLLWGRHAMAVNAAE